MILSWRISQCGSTCQRQIICTHNNKSRKHSKNMMFFLQHLHCHRFHHLELGLAINSPCSILHIIISHTDHFTQQGIKTFIYYHSQTIHHITFSFSIGRYMCTGCVAAPPQSWHRSAILILTNINNIKISVTSVTRLEITIIKVAQKNWLTCSMKSLM